MAKCKSVVAEAAIGHSPRLSVQRLGRQITWQPLLMAEPAQPAASIPRVGGSCISLPLPSHTIPTEKAHVTGRDPGQYGHCADHPKEMIGTAAPARRRR